MLVRNHSRFIVIPQTLLLSEQLFLNLHGDLEIPVLDVCMSLVSDTQTFDHFFINSLLHSKRLELVQCEYRVP